MLYLGSSTARPVPPNERATEPADPSPAKFFQAKPKKTKKNQEKPRKKSLDFLGFLRPNRDISMGYRDSQGKNPFALLSVRRRRLSRNESVSATGPM
jgi:hypothetical protein